MARGIPSGSRELRSHPRKPLGVTPYWPASRLPEGRQDPKFRTKPVLAWELIEEAWQSGIPFRAVVADCIYGEHPTFTANLFCADIPYVVAVHSNHGVWQFVEDPANPPAFNPREAAERVPLDRWQRVERRDSHGKELVHYVVDLELGNAYGPRRNWRLIAATTDPTTLKKDATWSPISPCRKPVRGRCTRPTARETGSSTSTNRLSRSWGGRTSRRGMPRRSCATGTW